MNQPHKSALDTIGVWRYPNDRFVYEKVITLRSTNVVGNTYFSNYIEWQGEARERLFLAHPGALEFLKGNPQLLMITHTLHHRFHKNTFFGDCVRIEVTSKDILDYSLMLNFRYFNSATDELVGEGWQKICFWDGVINQPAKTPQIFLDIAKSILEK